MSPSSGKTYSVGPNLSLDCDFIQHHCRIMQLLPATRLHGRIRLKLKEL
jgi:hypothetical protein